jgi:hypothetical protein
VVVSSSGRVLPSGNARPSTLLKLVVVVIAIVLLIGCKRQGENNTQRERDSFFSKLIVEMFKTPKCARRVFDDDVAVSKTIVVVFPLNENVTKDDVRTSSLSSIIDTRQSFFYSPTRQ